MQAQADTQNALQAMAELADKIISAADVSEPEGEDRVERARLTGAIRQRLSEASLLLRLATGTSEPVCLEVQPLLRAVLAADKEARVVLNTDIDITHMSQAQQDEAIAAMELAEVGYTQWRCMSALALMHLSNVFRATEKARNVAGD